MSEKDKDMIKRYIYEVTRRLSGEQREEIGQELQELISDMAEGENISVEEVLLKLGNPVEFAKRYRDDTSYVVGPDYYDNYIWVMKIVLATVLISALISGIVQGIMDSSGLITMITIMIGSTIQDAIISAISAFGAVTLIFAVLERQKVKVDLKKEKQWESGNREWTPKLLLPLPDKRAVISRGESVVGIVFLSIFCAILLFAPQLFGAYIFEQNQLVGTIPIFNLAKWNIILPFLLLSVLAGFADEVIRLAAGCYGTVVMISNIVSGIVQIFCATLILKVLPFWNPNFVKDISEQFHKNINSRGDLLYYWGTDLFSNIMLVIICVAILIEMGTTIYKSLKYRVENHTIF